jgi:hypothetical protein
LFLGMRRRTDPRTADGLVFVQACPNPVDSYRARQSILLHAAWRNAIKGNTVLFVSTRARLHKSQILLPHGATSDDSIWCRVGIRYLTCRDDLLKLSSALPLLPAAEAPDLVIIDDEGDLLSQPRSSLYVQERSICASASQLLLYHVLCVHSEDRNLRALPFLPSLIKAPSWAQQAWTT